MTRTKSSPVKCVPSSNGSAKSFLLILRDDLLRSDERKEGSLDLVKLRHPRSGCGTLFLFSPDNAFVQEVFSLSEKRSWFVNDAVRENGEIHISTPFDPMFLVLPYLKKSREEKKCLPLEDLLIDDVFPETLRILNSFALRNIHLLADKKGTEDLNVWVYNKEKVLKWLCRKTEKVAEILTKKQINVGEGAASKNFVKSVKQDSYVNDKESYLKYASKLVSEYLTDDLSLELSSSLGLPSQELLEKKDKSKRKLTESEQLESVKKIKRETEELDISKSEKPKSLSSREKAMMKAASGSKSITSFFKKK